MHDNINEVDAQKILRYAKLISKKTALEIRHMGAAMLGSELNEIDRLLAEIALPHDEIIALAAQNLKKDGGC